MKNQSIMRRTAALIILLLNLQFLFSQSLNRLSQDEKGNDILLGEINKFGLTQHSFNTWFSKNYDAYLVHQSLVKQLKDSLNTYHIKVFLGTWCGDSKREVPKFYKILDAAKFSENQLQVIAVNKTEDAYKQSPNHEEKGLNIHRVPTFIFYKSGKEVNRIVEFPKETLERDIHKIVIENKYTPNYAVANYMNTLFKTTSLDSLKSAKLELVSKFREFVKGSRELNTFGYMLLRSNQLEKALFVFNLNTKLFPSSPNVYDSLAEVYLKQENYSDAIKNYYKVLSLKPDDSSALEMVEHIKAKQKL